MAGFVKVIWFPSSRDKASGSQCARGMLYGNGIDESSFEILQDYFALKVIVSRNSY